MKLDQVNRDRRFTKRLIGDFTGGLLGLLQKKPLEEITVGELCAQTNYPRSTFYNYFEDIYALMDCCWKSVSESMGVTDFQSIALIKERFCCLTGCMTTWMPTAAPSKSS